MQAARYHSAEIIGILLVLSLAMNLRIILLLHRRWCARLLHQYIRDGLSLFSMVIAPRILRDGLTRLWRAGHSLFIYAGQHVCVVYVKPLLPSHTDRAFNATPIFPLFVIVAPRKWKLPTRYCFLSVGKCKTHSPEETLINNDVKAKRPTTQCICTHIWRRGFCRMNIYVPLHWVA